MITTLADIESKLDFLVERLDEIINNALFENCKILVLSESIDYKVLEDYKHKGVYLIEIKTNSNSLSEWIEEFRSIWSKDEMVKNKHAPKIIKKRVDKHAELPKWLPLYIGKSENIAKRIEDHITLKFSQSTTGLKLLERKELYGYEFRFSVIKISTKHYNMVVSRFEDKLRDKFNPIIGR